MCLLFFRLALCWHFKKILLPFALLEITCLGCVWLHCHTKDLACHNFFGDCFFAITVACQIATSPVIDSFLSNFIKSVVNKMHPSLTLTCMVKCSSNPNKPSRCSCPVGLPFSLYPH
jgi:hypothetical protein